MKKNIKIDKKNEVVVPFRGAKLNTDEADKTGFYIFSGIIGIVLALIFFGKDQKIYSLILIGLFSGISFFGYGFLKKYKKIKKK